MARTASRRIDVHKRERRNFRDDEKRYSSLKRSRDILMRITNTERCSTSHQYKCGGQTRDRSQKGAKRRKQEHARQVLRLLSPREVPSLTFAFFISENALFTPVCVNRAGLIRSSLAVSHFGNTTLSGRCSHKTALHPCTLSPVSIALMPKSGLLGRLRGRRKARVLIEDGWRPTSDFNILSDKIYHHIIRTDRSPLNGLPLLDMRKYLNWWKLRTCGRNIEFTNLPVCNMVGNLKQLLCNLRLHLKLTLIPEEEEAALCLLLEAAGIKYNLETVCRRMVMLS